jgi:hypothetical protein
VRYSRQKFEYAAGQYRSGLEKQIREELEADDVSFSYECLHIPYKVQKTYTPDIVLENGIIIEIKGLFDSEDRTKHKLVRQQHPELDIRFVFQRASTKISKTSKTTYADWCRKNGFQWAEKSIPRDWIQESGKKNN